MAVEFTRRMELTTKGIGELVRLKVEAARSSNPETSMKVSFRTEKRMVMEDICLQITSYTKVIGRKTFTLAKVNWSWLLGFTLKVSSKQDKLKAMVSR